MFEIARQAFDEVMREWRRQAAVRELSKLSDHLLADIGLRRDQLPTYMTEATGEDERMHEIVTMYRPELAPCG